MVDRSVGHTLLSLSPWMLLGGVSKFGERADDGAAISLGQEWQLWQWALCQKQWPVTAPVVQIRPKELSL